jgi:hypothetical protein
VVVARAVATTRSPRRRASWQASAPTAPPAPVTRTFAPDGRSRASKACSAVKPANGNVEA